MSSIHFCTETKTFYLQTKNTSYAFYVSDFDALEHLYYGKKVPMDNLKYMGNRQWYAHHVHESRDSRDFSASSLGAKQAMGSPVASSSITPTGTSDLFVILYAKR